MRRQLLPALGFVLISGAQAAAQTQVVTATVDTFGFDSIAILANVGTIAAGGTVTMKVLGGEASNGSDKAAIAGAQVVAIDSDDDKKLVIEIHRPTSRYITVTLDRAVANSNIVSVEAVLFGASSEPVAQDGVSKSVALVSPLLA